MRLSRKEIEKVVEEYRLGDLEGFRHFPSGMVNYNSDVTTSKGDFVIKRLGHELSDKWRLRKDAEVGVLEFLEGRDLPFDVPRYLRARNGSKMFEIDENVYQVYPRIEGENISVVDEEELGEIVKSIAIYHNAIREYDPPSRLRIRSGTKWMRERFDRDLKGVESRNEVDDLMLANLKYFDSVLESALSVDIDIDPLMVHGDLVHVDKGTPNMLFQRRKLSGFLDFENTRYQPKAYDVAQLIRLGDTNLVVGEYRKHGVLSTEEEDNLNVFGVIHYCNIFRLYYAGLEITPELQLERLKMVVRDGREFIDGLGINL